PLLAQILAQALSLLVETPEPGQAERATLLCREFLHMLGAGSADGNQALIGPVSLMAASACALRQRLPDVALAFWTHFRLRCKVQGNAAARPTPPELCLNWAEAMRAAGELFALGFIFDPGKNTLPENALSWLLLAEKLDPDRAPARRVTDLLRPRKELLSMHMEYLARMSLYDPQSVNAQLEYGLACIKACRVREGLFEIAEARGKAEKSGQSAAFSARLKALSPVERDWGKVLQIFT
ncbi:MAG: hypothetical protein LBN33_02430, partial [Desulfovibrio sp.]|nr:hypothetical protein [Desulfovibrio sp.]